MVQLEDEQDVGATKVCQHNICKNSMSSTKMWVVLAIL